MFNFIFFSFIKYLSTICWYPVETLCPGIISFWTSNHTSWSINCYTWNWSWKRCNPFEEGNFVLVFLFACCLFPKLLANQVLVLNEQVTEACNTCFEQRQIFTQQVLAKVLNQLVCWMLSPCSYFLAYPPDFIHTSHDVHYAGWTDSSSPIIYAYSYASYWCLSIPGNMTTGLLTVFQRWSFEQFLNHAFFLIIWYWFSLCKL